MNNNKEDITIVKQRREQMLKLVAKGFYNELTNYGVNKDEILKVASHLLDNLLSPDSSTGKDSRFYNDVFQINQVRDDWAANQSLGIGPITLSPLQPGVLSLVARWLAHRPTRESFVPAFPESERELREYFARPDREYMVIEHEGKPIGFVGGENIDRESGKLEMKKLVGDKDLQSRGIGKRATFGFLYFAFMILDMHKVYIHSRDINMRNINLNSRFGFDVEAVFFEDLVADGKRSDVVRMALFKPLWLALFSK